MQLIKVLHGRPSPEQLAALIAVIQARTAATAATAAALPRKPPVSAWTNRAAAIALRRRSLPRSARHISTPM
ncbi:acyl-CoA carboxylase subunit epsilon [Streptomyces xantholiticus]|uniref:Acyl-CoA carboxylase subunit epsilon n=1 Tax=Streptomyces xantholiticus TaxID=68285 RepID=A0ABV1V7B5_9ACTN